MRVVLLAAANNIHTIRWANGLVERDVEVYLLSAQPLGIHQLDKRVNLHLLPFKAPWGYIASVYAVNKLLATIKPHVVNAHYATGYGLLARLTQFKPLVLCVWGSDIFSFPNKSAWHFKFVKANVKAATAIASASHCLAREVVKVSPHPHIFITPFGIDVQTFAPHDNTRDKGAKNLVIGTVKALKPQYGIDILIKAFAIAHRQVGHEKDLRLEITGGGGDLAQLQELVREQQIADRVTFHGVIAHQKIPEMLCRLDIYVALSREESFGVAILEANACEKPVVVSNAEGLAEITIDGVTGLVVPRENVQAAAEAILKLINDQALRVRLGQQGRKHIIEHYSWDKCVEAMIEVYKKAIRLTNTM